MTPKQTNEKVNKKRMSTRSQGTSGKRKTRSTKKQKWRNQSQARDGLR